MSLVFLILYLVSGTLFLTFIKTITEREKELKKEFEQLENKNNNQ